MLKVLIYETRDFSSDVIEKLRKSGFDVTLNNGEFSFQAGLESFDVIYIRLGVKISFQLLDNCPNLLCKYIIVPATGIDHIDEDACRNFGIKVISFKNRKDLLRDIRATAELTIALSLNLMRKIIPAVNSTKNGQWDRDSFRGRDIFGSNVGIIGYGRLGKIVSEYYYSLGANVFVFEISDILVPSFITKCNSIDEIFKISDIVSIHVDYKPSNIDLINKYHFQIAHKVPILINTSRGQIINEVDLLWALENKKIAGAALDVVNEELHFDNRNKLVLFANINDNLIITPHIGGCTIDSSHKTEEIITDLFLQIINSK